MAKLRKDIIKERLRKRLECNKKKKESKSNIICDTFELVTKKKEPPPIVKLPGGSAAAPPAPPPSPVIEPIHVLGSPERKKIKSQEIVDKKRS